ncbi:hypothetical protein CVV68_16455 [Arthrobacter livingstonensis]|uniref:DUF1616 domain-containing protein n=1 Tax=Arthrobacter livingstonensis TaxID=670078 RepID=A0A2V5L3X0_9MICC|nr:hypothetical protein [Arthrobacter livingstonensis]PYI65818.1 hypothetical protein CVV68_16455 [Arthrobacter livingstonensis]
MNERGILKTGAVVVAVALLLVLAAETDWVRPLCAAAFCLLVPGYGWARRMHLKDKGDTLALSAVFSICATVAVGTVMAVGRWWSPWTGFAALLLITLCGFIPLRRTEAGSNDSEKGFRWHLEFPAQAPEPNLRPGDETGEKR